ncbi:hypothetical protein IC575_004288 [Cucumis melo]
MFGCFELLGFGGFFFLGVAFALLLFEPNCYYRSINCLFVCGLFSKLLLLQLFSHGNVSNYQTVEWVIQYSLLHILIFLHSLQYFCENLIKWIY